ncbi:MAG: pyruvate formate lyase family protein, partial [Clostridia bacterium]|nr:pyruvate formate lyase family protein [Clostridia bacterium]
MDERIAELTRRTLAGEMFIPARETVFDREDLFLPKDERDVKHLCEYILNQEPLITEYSCFTGLFRFDGSVVGDAFRRAGHPETGRALSLFYLKPVDHLSTMEWQHATADYQKVLTIGISGMIEEIDRSLAVHTGADEQSFLRGVRAAAGAMIGWQKKCADRTAAFAEQTADPVHKKNLLRLAETLERVPEQAPSTFYEAVLTIYLCFSADPDSLGTLDRYLAPFYERDKAAGILSDEDARAYLQELFLMVQACTPRSSGTFTKGGESHFCIGGYLPDGTDCFSPMTRLIVDSLMELPTYIPQITFRWTKKTSHEVLRYMMDMERHDKNKRIAFTNDEKRIRSYTEICGIPYSRAVGYTMVGCNEPAFLGAITGSNSKINFLRAVETLFHKKADIIRNASDFDSFYQIYEAEMLHDLALGYDYDNKYNLCRSRDVNYISSLFFNDCAENAKSLTQGGGNTVVASPMLLG